MHKHQQALAAENFMRENAAIQLYRSGVTETLGARKNLVRWGIYAGTAKRSELCGKGFKICLLEPWRKHVTSPGL